MLLHNSIRQIFDFLIFCRDMASFLQKNSRFWDFHLFTRPYLGKKSKNQKFDGQNCGEAYFVCLSQNLALEIGLELSFCDFEPFFKNKNLVFWGIYLVGLLRRQGGVKGQNPDFFRFGHKTQQIQCTFMCFRQNLKIWIR